MNISNINEALDALESGVSFLKKLNAVSVQPTFTEKQVSEAREKIRLTREKFLLSQKRISFLAGGTVTQNDISKFERNEHIAEDKLSQIMEYCKGL